MVAAAAISLPAAVAISGDLSDQHLLARFVSQRDDAAFVQGGSA